MQCCQLMIEQINRSGGKNFFAIHGGGEFEACQRFGKTAMVLLCQRHGTVSIEAGENHDALLS
ncbi:hypothetical protein A15D_00315 [Alcanivorax sp. MD8A]|nr:hypothetical protein A15D_00315 [Alcanivorax sp. MD8A]